MDDQVLRDHLLYLLDGGGAHVKLEAALSGVPADVRGKKPDGGEYTLWQLLEHIRIAQWDILEFSRNPNHVSPDWPAGYWPKTAAPPSPAAWDHSIRSLLADLEAMRNLVKKESTDLAARIPHGEGQTLLREALLVADHNAYHLGQFVLTRKLLNAWK